MRSLHRKTRTAFSAREHQFGRMPTEEEVATAVGIEVADLRRVDRGMALTRVASLDAPIHVGGGDETMNVHDLLPGHEVGDTLPQPAELSVLLVQAMCRLPLTERVLLQLNTWNA